MHLRNVTNKACTPEVMSRCELETIGATGEKTIFSRVRSIEGRQLWKSSMIAESPYLQRFQAIRRPSPREDSGKRVAESLWWQCIDHPSAPTFSPRLSSKLYILLPGRRCQQPAPPTGPNGQMGASSGGHLR